LDNYNAALSRKQPVTLIGETGAPKWHRWQHGQGQSQFSLAADGTFSVHTRSICLLELLPGAPLDSYSVRMQVRHEKTDASGEVGLYIGHERYGKGPPHGHFFVHMSYNDLKDVRKQILLRLDDKQKQRLNQLPGLMNTVRLEPIFKSKERHGLAGST